MAVPRSESKPHNVTDCALGREVPQPIAEFRKSWATACKKASWEGRTFHDLRRSAARQLIRSGVTKDDARQLGGWKTESVFSRYNVCDEEDLRDAMEKVTTYNEAESQKVVTIAR
jgi:integrase